MLSNNWLLLLFIIQLITKGSSKTPSLSPCASWNQSGLTVAGSSNGLSGSSLSELDEPLSLSISKDDIIYISDGSNHRIVVVQSDSISNKFTIGSGPGSDLSEFNNPRDLFVTNTSLYVIDFSNSRLQKTSLNGSDPISVLNLTNITSSHYLYVDDNANIYISDTEAHRVLMFPSNSANYTVVAGTRVLGSNDVQLNAPYGIFVNEMGTIYIADRSNHRIMRWFSEAMSGARVAGDGTSGVRSTQINYPTQIIVDTNEYMYITEGGNSRLTRWTPNSTFGICIVACTELFDAVSTQLWNPHSLAFDSHGSLYVTDRGHHRVQKFQILNQIVSSNDSNRTNMDPYRNISQNICDILQPCQNNGTCDDDITSRYGYRCSCPLGFNGTECQFDHRACKPGTCLNQGICTERPDVTFVCACRYGFFGRLCEIDGRICKADTCRNNGTCRKIPNTTFLCKCNLEWEGVHCEKRVDYCSKVTCQNNGVCCSLFLNYSCQCLRDSYTGRYCEIKMNQSVPIISMEPSTEPFTFIQNCSAPRIELIPSSFLISTPWKFRPNQDIYISSSIEIICPQSVAFERKWTIRNWSSICSNQTALLPSEDTISNDLFIPARTLPDGIYEITLTITVLDYSALSLSSFVYIEITRSTIIANLIPLNALLITHDYEEDLVLNPGQFSVDLNDITFNPHDWFYSYYCRTYPVDHFQVLRSFDDPNQNCFSNETTSWKYNNLINSSITISAKSMHLNETFQLMVQLIHRDNPLLHSIGYLAVEVKQSRPPIIKISCVVLSMCLSNGQFFYANPTTQLILFTLCSGDCSTVEKIQWDIYQGSINSSDQTVQWTRFFPNTLACFYGFNTKNLTVLKEFFTSNRESVYWRFQAIYSFGLEISKDQFDIEINQAPRNGNCSIDPLNGTMLTLFTIICSNWYDEDAIKDWTFYGWSQNSSTRFILGHTTKSVFELRLPASVDHISTFSIVVQIRDTFDCVYEVYLPSVYILRDDRAILNFLDTLQKTSNQLDNDTITQLLNSGDRNIVEQLVTSIGQLFNEINNQTIELAARNGIPPGDISITSLNNPILHKLINFTNDTLLSSIKKQINIHAQAREYLMMLATNLPIKTPDDVKFQSSILARLTEATNQLTRKTAALASDQCHRLSNALKSMTRRLSLDDVHLTAIHLAECATNAFNGINGLLQGRANALQLDLFRTKEVWDNDGDYFEYHWNDIDAVKDERDDNLYRQKRAFRQIIDQTNATISSITSALNVHLNLNQTVQINEPSVWMSLEKLTNTSLSARLNITSIDLPFNIRKISNTFLVRRIIQPLASSDNDYRTPSFTNLSRSLSLSIFDEHERELQIQTDRIEFFIPRDPNLIMPPMFVQNVTDMNETNRLFNYHMVNLTQRNRKLTFSMQFELHPLKTNLSYLFTYQFADRVKFNCTLFCSADLNTDENYVHFLDNEQVLNHHSIVYGIRELNSIEMSKFCANKTFYQENVPAISEPVQFTSAYQIRVYQSGCFYLDENQQRQSDGLVVGPSTNHFQTQCFSTHLPVLFHSSQHSILRTDGNEN